MQMTQFSGIHTVVAEMMEIISEIKDENRKLGLYINTSKTKILELTLPLTGFEIVQKLTYLGLTVQFRGLSLTADP